MSKVDLGTDLHVKQLARSRYSRWLLVRIAKAIYKEVTRGPGAYGTEWGDPEVWTPLRFVRDRYVLPFVNPKGVAVEIGCGGGRWTRFLLGFKKVYAVDYYEPLLLEFKKSFDRYKNVVAVKNNGTDFPGIAPHSVDYVFSFGCFGHLNLTLIDSYLGQIKSILAPGGNAVIHFSDKNKLIAQDPAFSDNSPDKMRLMVLRHGFEIVEVDTGTMWNGAIIHFKA
jgi:SAM-dependent methyltransferase